MTSRNQCGPFQLYQCHCDGDRVHCRYAPTWHPTAYYFEQVGADPELAKQRRLDNSDLQLIMFRAATQNGGYTSEVSELIARATYDSQSITCPYGYRIDNLIGVHFCRNPQAQRTSNRKAI